MNKRIKNKTIKNNNTNAINSILEKLNYKVVRKVFGDGYFIFTFQKNSICWFWLKEFPNWRFGIWLNKDETYSIFGEHDLLIDKFKPSATYISETNVIDFNNILKNILNKTKEHLEYMNDIKEAIEYENKINNYNFKIFNKVKDFIKEFNKNNKLELVLKDNGENCSPRYYIELHNFDETDSLSKEEEIDLILNLSKELDELYIESSFYIHSYIIYLSKVSIELLSNKELEYKNNNYWKNQYKDYKDYILKNNEV